MRDPRCPACAGKVSATADYCMHCGAEFEAPAEADAVDESTGSAGTVTVSDAGVGTATGRTGVGSARSRTETADAQSTPGSAREWTDAGDRTGAPAVGTGRDRSDVLGALGSGLETTVATALAPLIALLDRSETLVWTVVLAVSLLAFLFVGASFPGAWFPGYSVAAVVGAALAVYVGGQTHADQLLAATGIGSGVIVLGTRLLGLAGLAVGEGLDAAATRLPAAVPSLLLAAGLLSVGLLLRKR